MHATRFLFILMCVCGLGAGTVLLTGCGGDATKTAEAACSCESDKAADAGWCEKCSVGYIKGTKTKCQDCVTAAQGGEPCKACTKEAAGDGKGGMLAETTGGAIPGGAAADAFVKGEAASDGKGECKGDCANCKNKDCPCKAEKAGGESSEVACVCAKGKAGEPVWCKACNVGYVDGKKAGCPGCVKNALKKLEAEKSPD